MKILHLEDDREDTAPVRERLRDAWPDCEITPARNEAEYRARLASADYDLILSDFPPGCFDGTAALRLARERLPGTPFVFLSGSIGEDRAPEAGDAGDADHGLKARIRRLVTAIQRARRERREGHRLHLVEADRERLAAILESTPDFVGMAAPDGRVLFLNRAARQMLGLPDGPLPEDLNAANYRAPEVARRAVGENFAAAMRDGTWSGESILLARDGRTIPVSQVLIAHRDAAGDVTYLSTVMRDLTARKQSEALVNGQNQVLEMIAGGEPVAETLATLLQFIERQCDEMICSILLLDDDGQRLRHCAAPRLPAAFSQAIDGLPVGPAAGSCGTAAHRRATVIVGDIATDPLWADYRALAQAHHLRACWSEPIFDVQHRLLGTFAVYQTQPGVPAARHRQLIEIAIHIAAICLIRHRAERQLRDQADILNKAGDAIVVTDPSHRITFWNAGAQRTFGWSAAEALGRRTRDLFPPAAAAEIDAVAQAVAPKGEWTGEVRLPDRHGRPLIMESRVTTIRDDAGRPQGLLTISTDVTAKKSIEEQFFRAQRLESIGMLAAGIAHDLNNILAPIMLAAPLLRDRVTDPGDIRILTTLERSAERGAALVRQILGFARGAEGEHRLVQPRQLLRDVAAFVLATFPKSIRLEETVAAGLWPVKANPTQLHQVLLNLCVNARDAMPHGGILTLRGENGAIDETAARAIAGSRVGRFLVLHVQDTGTGISPEALAHIWEPFYTTKGAGKGTGLGLSTVRGIVEHHAGFVTVATAADEGTTFRVYLPAAAPDAGEPAASAAAFSPRGGGELVLVVDDEASIRNLCAAVLSQHGYRVLTAADGAEAMALFAPRNADIRVVITDLSMPNLDGATLAGMVHRMNPAVKIVAFSGHGADSHGRPPAHQFTHAFLVKPFPPEALLASVYSLLHDGAGRPA